MTECWTSQRLGTISSRWPVMRGTMGFLLFMLYGVPSRTLSTVSSHRLYPAVPLHFRRMGWFRVANRLSFE
jgi:hypothetical protein